MDYKPMIAAMMRCVAAVAALAGVVPAQAQTQAAYHLVITYSPGGVSVIPYATAARCEQARRALEIDRQRRIRDSRVSDIPGAVVVGVPYHLQGVCVPG